MRETYYQVRLCRAGTTDQEACIGIGPHYASPDAALPLAKRCNLRDGGAGLRYAVFECDARTDRALRAA